MAQASKFVVWWNQKPNRTNQFRSVWVTMTRYINSLKPTIEQISGAQSSGVSAAVEDAGGNKWIQSYWGSTAKDDCVLLDKQGRQIAFFTGAYVDMTNGQVLDTLDYYEANESPCVTSPTPSPTTFLTPSPTPSTTTFASESTSIHRTDSTSNLQTSTLNPDSQNTDLVTSDPNRTTTEGSTNPKSGSEGNFDSGNGNGFAMTAIFGVLLSICALL